jgi:hypothetical protein
MRFIHAITIVTLAGSAASAQPVARDLIDDADVVEVLFTDLADTLGLNITGFGSIHRLDDLDGDGVDEVLLTHVSLLPTPTTLNEDFYSATVRSPRTGTTLLPLAPDETEVIKLAHASASVIDDIDGDGVRDIAVGRCLFGVAGIGLRVHSGATGEIIRAPYGDDFIFNYGVSMLPWDDIDGDGQPDLLLGSQASSPAFAYWSPGSGAVSFFTPSGFSIGGGISGFSLLDLGVGASGSRELLATSVTSGLASSVAWMGGDPFRVVALASSQSVLTTGYAAHLGDLDQDGHADIVLSGQTLLPGTPVAAYGIPIFSGAVPDQPNTEVRDPIAVQTPQFLVVAAGGSQMFQPGGALGLAPLGDATGDGFPDYACVSSFRLEGELTDNFCVVAVCGRTGRAFFAAEQQNPAGPGQEVLFTRSLDFNRSGQISRGRDAMASPGDINGDGAPDLIMLVQRYEYGDGSSDPIVEQLLLTHYLPTPCVGDVDFDRVVNFADLNAVLSNFGAQDITLPADLNASGVVDFADLNLVLSAFGQACD